MGKMFPVVRVVVVVVVFLGVVCASHHTAFKLDGIKGHVNVLRCGAISSF
jgi:hypothetical protein